MKSFFHKVAIFFLLTILVGPLLRSADPNAMDLSARFEGPTLSAPLGRDHHGSDLFSRILKGAQTSLIVGLSVVACAGVLGLVIGGMSGFKGGLLDSSVMGLTEVMLSIPGVLLSMVLTLMMEPSILNLCFALMMTAWITSARIVRSEMIRIKHLEYVEAARALGASEGRVLFQHLLPAVFPLLLVTAMTQLPGVILSEAALSYLGLGLPLDQPSLGQMIAQGRKYFIESPYQTVVPGLMVLAVVLCSQRLLTKDRLKMKSR